MPEITPRVLLFTVSPLPDGTYLLDNPANQLDREDATYQLERDIAKPGKVRLSKGDEPKACTILFRSYGPDFDETYIKAKDANE